RAEVAAAGTDRPCYHRGRQRGGRPGPGARGAAGGHRARPDHARDGRARGAGRPEGRSLHARHPCRRHHLQRARWGSAPAAGRPGRGHRLEGGEVLRGGRELLPRSAGRSGPAGGALTMSFRQLSTTGSRPVTILNVDDYPPGLYARSRILRQAGFEVREASTGAEALRLVKSEKPDLVLLDVNLPDINGMEVCRRIKSNPETAAMLVLHLSATSVPEADRIRALESGADSSLIEPIEPDELIANLHALLRMRRAEETLRQRERQLQGLLDHTPSVVFMKDLEGRYLLVNREYERV